jgi:predicted RNase H-like HicB family nuclease
MRFPVMIEKVRGADEPEGLYYASVPTLGLVTHGPGIEEAMEAARDLVTLWLEEVRDPEGRQTYVPMHTKELPSRPGR